MVPSIVREIHKPGDDPSERWVRSAESLTATFVFADFREAFGFVTQVALLAERQNHHPDITISWNRVTVSTSSHDTDNTVTARDVRLAIGIDRLVGAGTAL